MNDTACFSKCKQSEWRQTRVSVWHLCWGGDQLVCLTSPAHYRPMLFYDGGLISFVRSEVRESSQHAGSLLRFQVGVNRESSHRTVYCCSFHAAVLFLISNLKSDFIVFIALLYIVMCRVFVLLRTIVFNEGKTLRDGNIFRLKTLSKFKVGYNVCQGSLSYHKTYEWQRLMCWQE